MYFREREGVSFWPCSLFHQPIWISRVWTWKRRWRGEIKEKSQLCFFFFFQASYHTGQVSKYQKTKIWDETTRFENYLWHLPSFFPTLITKEYRYLRTVNTFVSSPYLPAEELQILRNTYYKEMETKINNAINIIAWIRPKGFFPPWKLLLWDPEALHPEKNFSNKQNNKCSN